MNFNINHLSSAKFHKNWSGAKYKDQIFENSTYSEHWQNIKGSNIIMVMFFIDKIRYSLKNYVSDIFYATVSILDSIYLNIAWYRHGVFALRSWKH